MNIEISTEKRVTYLQKRITELESILSENTIDFSRVGVMLHQLQGSSPTFGFDELVDQVTFIQDELRSEQDTAYVRTLLKNLLMQLGASKDSVKESVYL